MCSCISYKQLFCYSIFLFIFNYLFFNCSISCFNAFIVNTFHTYLIISENKLDYNIHSISLYGTKRG